MLDEVRIFKVRIIYLNSDIDPLIFVFSEHMHVDSLASKVELCYQI